MPCKHKTIDNHTLGHRGTHPRVWICSNCKRQFRWVDGESGYFGNWECPKCQFARIDAVACSEACRKVLEVQVRKEKQASKKVVMKVARSPLPPQPKNGICDTCKERSKDGLFKCSGCEKTVCADHCCGGAGTQCFDCENNKGE